MKILFLGPPKKEIIQHITETGDEVKVTEEKLSLDSPIIQEIDF